MDSKSDNQVYSCCHSDLIWHHSKNHCQGIVHEKGVCVLGIQLIDEQKRNKDDISEENLEKFQSDQENFVWRFVTMVETWIYYFDPETEQQFMT